MAVTIKDIAALAGVSPTAVSLALNGKKGVSEETKAEIIRIARDLGYSAALQKEKISLNKTIRFLRISIHGRALNRDLDVFISDYIEGLTAGAKLLKYNLEIDSFKNIPIEEIIESVKAGHLDGIIVLGTELTKEHIKAFDEISIPSVFIDTYDAFLPNNFVDMNNREAVYQIITHLKEQGMERIGMIASKVPSSNFQFRKDAFLEVVSLEIESFDEENLLEVDPTFDGAYEDMKGYLEKKIRLPECFFCANDIIAYGCMKALKERGIRIPRDISIVGFDDLPLSSLMDPPLTSIRVPKLKIGRMAITILNELIESAPQSGTYKTIIDGSLIQRESVRRTKKITYEQGETYEK